jgi:hypothetical protein
LRGQARNLRSLLSAPRSLPTIAPARSRQLLWSNASQGASLPVQACLTDAGDGMIEESNLELFAAAYPERRSHRGRPPT